MLRQFIVNKKLENLFLYSLVIFSVFIHIYFSIQGWSNAVGGIRESQTALTAYFLKQGGAFFKYETPIFGPPWSWPMELPIYQACVSYFSSFFEISIDSSCRFISLLSFFLIIIPTFKILDFFEYDDKFKKIFLILFSISPIYIYQSRNSLIEVFALLLSVSFIAFALTHIKYNKKNDLIFAAIFATLAGLQKITTFIPAAFLFLIIDLSLVFKSKTKEHAYRFFSHFFTFIFVPLLIVQIWVQYSDLIKIQNPISFEYLSSNLKEFNFRTGKWLSSLTLSFWKDTLFRTAIHDILGHRFVFLISIFFAFLCKSKRYMFFLLTFLSAPIIFTNLYVTHRYYLVAIGFYLILGTTIIFAKALSFKKIRPLLYLFLVYVIFINIKEYNHYYHPLQVQKNIALEHFAKKINENTTTSEVIIISGVGHDPTIPYLAKRRSILFNGYDLERFEKTKDLLINNDPLLRIGGLILCQEQNEFNYLHYKKIKNILNATTVFFMSNFENQPQSNQCGFYKI